MLLTCISERPQLSPCAYILLNSKSHCHKTHTWLNGGFKQDSLHRTVWKWVWLRNGHSQAVLNGHRQVTSLGGEMMKCRNVMCIPNKELMSQVVPQLEQKQSQDGLKITLLIAETAINPSCGEPQKAEQRCVGQAGWFLFLLSRDSLSTTAAAIIWRPKLVSLKWYSAASSLFPVMYLLVMQSSPFVPQ